MKAYKDEETGFMVLELDWYEAGVLANAANDLRKCSTGEYDDFYIGGACIHIKITQHSESDLFR